MRPERIAELRDLISEYERYPDWYRADPLAKAAPELLDELEEATHAALGGQRLVDDLRDELEACRKGYQMWVDAEAKCNAELEAMKAERDDLIAEFGQFKEDERKLRSRLYAERDGLAAQLEALQTRYEALRIDHTARVGDGQNAQDWKQRADSLALQLQEAEAENEGLRRDLGRGNPPEYRCLKAKGWLCGLGYGHTGGCMAVNHPHPLGGD